MKNMKRLVDLVVIGSKEEPELKDLQHYSPVIITNGDSEVVFAGLQQPSTNFGVISSEGITDIYKIRERFKIDEPGNELDLKVVSGYHFYKKNIADPEIFELEDKHLEVESLFMEILGKQSQEILAEMPKPVVELAANVVVEYDVLANFSSIGLKQRGDAEHVMLKYQKSIGSGVYSNALEHIGDLIHRCTHMIHMGNPCHMEMSEKFARCLRN